MNCVLWVDNLCVASAVRVVGADLRGHGIREIRYLYRGRKGRILARLLKSLGILRVPFVPVALELGDMRSDDGSSLYYSFQDDVLRIAGEITAELEHDYPLQGLLGSELPEDKVRFFLEKSIASEIYPSIMLCTIIDWQSRNLPEMRGIEHTLLTRSTWASYLAPLLERKGLRLRGYSLLGQATSPFQVILRLVIALTRLILAAGRALLQGSGARRQDDTTAPVIAVQHADGVDLRQRADYFWLPGSGLDPGQVLVYFDRADKPATEEVVSVIHRLGARWVVARHAAARVQGSMCWKSNWDYVARSALSIGRSLRLAIVLGGGIRPPSFWLWERLQAMTGLVDWWESFFRAQNARVHMHTINHAPEIVAQALAIERAGGLSVGYQWSHYNDIDANHCRAHRVYFSWGPFYDDYIKKELSLLDHVVYSGHLSMYAHGTGTGDDRMPGILRGRGAEYVVCLFDSSFSSDTYYSRNMFIQLYEAFLREVLQDISLGLIIKPKNRDNLERLPEIAALLTESLQTGRCMVLDFECSPTEAARGADMAVGLGVNSAVIEAVLSGIPGIHCDLACKRDEPFYQWGYEKVVFDDIERLMQALREHRQDRQSRPFLGDHTPALEQIDPFQDGEGAVRLGVYLRWLMEAFGRGAGPAQAAEEARTRYQSQFGKDKVNAFSERGKAPLALVNDV